VAAGMTGGNRRYDMIVKWFEEFLEPDQPLYLWAQGYFVTTVGRDEEVIRAYIRNQELADRQLEQFELKSSAAQNPINRPNIP
jgi:hypothetical protein